RPRPRHRPPPRLAPGRDRRRRRSARAPFVPSLVPIGAGRREALRGSRGERRKGLDRGLGKSSGLWRRRRPAGAPGWLAGALGRGTGEADASRLMGDPWQAVVAHQPPERRELSKRRGFRDEASREAPVWGRRRGSRDEGAGLGTKA